MLIVQGCHAWASAASGRRDGWGGAFIATWLKPECVAFKRLSQVWPRSAPYAAMQQMCFRSLLLEELPASTLETQSQN